MASSHKPCKRLVVVSLHMDPSPPGFNYPRREIMLSTDSHTVKIGRASKVEAKGFVAAENNGWFDTPVMSREHAEIATDGKAVNITDTGSLHGTLVNGNPLLKNVPRQIQDGDKVQLGVAIFRASESYPPATVKVGIRYPEEEEWLSEEETQPNGSVQTFRAPEVIDCEVDDEDDGSWSDDNSIQLLPTQGAISENRDGHHLVTDLTGTDDGTDAVIDLTSPRTSPELDTGHWSTQPVPAQSSTVPALPSAPLSPRSPRYNAISPPPDGAYGGELPYEESISLQSDSYSDGDELADDTSDGTSSDESEMYGYPYNMTDSEMESELELRSELQDSEEEDFSDEPSVLVLWDDDPMDEEVFDVADQAQAPDQTPCQVTSTMAITEAPKNESELVKQALAGEVTPPTTFSKTNAIHISTLLNPTADSTCSQETKASPPMETFGSKTEKADYFAARFAAREYNKTLMAQKAATLPVHPASVHPIGIPSRHDGSLNWPVGQSEPDPVTLPRPASEEPPSQVQQDTPTVEETVELLANSALLEAGAKFLYAPSEKDVDIPPASPEDDEALVSAAVFQQHKLAAVSGGKPSEEKPSLKRKAGDMSQADELVQMVDASASTEPVTDKAPEPTERPMKRPKMSKTKSRAWAVAEKVTLAAVGGVLVLGSMIYTAPVLT